MEKADLEHNSKSNIHCSLLWLGRPVAFRDHWTVQAEGCIPVFLRLFSLTASVECQ